MTTMDRVKPAVNGSRDRGEPVPPEMLLDVARRVKEQHSYLASDIVKVNIMLVPLPLSALDARSCIQTPDAALCRSLAGMTSSQINSSRHTGGQIPRLASSSAATSLMSAS